MRLQDRRLIVAFSATVVALLVLPLARPVDAGTSTLEITEVITDAHPEVSLVVTAPAALATTELAVESFGVQENGRPLRLDVERVSSDGLEVVVVLDTSGSMAGHPIDAARFAAATFVLNLPPTVPAAVIGFGSVPTLAHGFSTDRESQVNAIGSLVPAGETALYDAVLAASTLEGTGASRRAIVLLSDGGDTVSTAALDDAGAALRHSGARPIVIELLSAENDRAALEALAAHNDGKVLAVGDATALADAFRGVTADLIGRYRLTFQSRAHGPTPVVVSLRRGEVTASASTTIDYPAAPIVVAPPRDDVSVRRPGLFGRSDALPVGAGLLFGALALLLSLVVVPSRRKIRLATVGSGGTRPSGRSALSDLAERASAVADRTLERRRPDHNLDALLEQAGIALRPGELLVVALAAMLAAFAVGLLLGGLVLGLALAVVAVVLSRGALAFLRDRRQGRFADQLDDVLQLLAGSLRAGYGLAQAIETASRELDGPAAEELRRLTTEVRLGRDLSDALDAMAARVANDDFGWVGQAIRIHREVGGDLAEVLDGVAHTIRERNKLRRQVSALSAEGRLSAYVLFALPLGIGGLVSVMNPEYIGTLFSDSLGIAMVVVGGVLMTVGGVWLRRLVRPVY